MLIEGTAFNKWTSFKNVLLVHVIISFSPHILKVRQFIMQRYILQKKVVSSNSKFTAKIQKLVILEKKRSK